MTLDELKKALEAADPAVVLVPGHLLSRVIREAHDVPPQTIQVPHRKSCILDRAVLFRHVEPDDLDIGPDRLLPPGVILLARPPGDRRTNHEQQSTLVRYWRRLFHANVHLQLEKLAVEGRLGPDAVAARVAEIGPDEFDEVRAVLQQEHYLYPGATPRDVYVEFAAVYLELRYFFPDLIAVFFPGIRDRGKIDRLLARDVDAEALFHRTRLAGAAEPPTRPDLTADEPSEYCWKLTREARAATRAGNTVRATILRTRAARIAPAALGDRLKAEVAADLQHFTTRLQKALKLTDDEKAEWLKDLPLLLDKTAEGQWSVEARLLYDLQNACVDHEREIYALDLVEWALSGGKRPMRRPLSNQRVVRITRHVRSASQRLSQTRLSEADRDHLGGLLREALHQSEERLRLRFRPVLINALNDVGLRAGDPAEQAALNKMVEELLDRVITLGFFTFGDLRDAISRNDLKLPDLADPRELLNGDPLLRLDRLLASSLDGVYRPSEVYLRFIQRVTAATFGTRAGRAFTRCVLLPVGGSVAILEGVDLVTSEYHKWFGDGARRPPLFGPVSLLQWVLSGKEPAAPVLWLAPALAALLTLFLLGLIYVPRVRRVCKEAGKKAYRAGKTVLVTWPARVLPLQALRRAMKGWPFQLFYGLVLKPLPICALLWWLFPATFETVLGAAAVFVGVTLALNSRPGRALDDVVSRLLVRFLGWIRSGLVGGIVNLVLRAFKRVTEGLEYVLYLVDELLRFRSGESRLSIALRALVGVLWFPVSYLARFYVVVLIEPGFNPIKAPISILAAKFVYPITLAVGFTPPRLAELLEPFLGSLVAQAFSYSTWWLLPDAVGFLVWETKENWKLYRANRPEALQPVSVGPRGETVLQLLKPGFHSGTLPKLFAQWREAEREAHQGAPWRAARACREKVEELREAVRRFVERDALALLNQGLAWRERPLSLARVDLASNQIRLELARAGAVDPPLRLAIAERAGRLVARVEEPGWLGSLSPGDRAALARMLAGLYKLAGVDLVAEQVRAALPPGAAWDVTDRGLVVRLGPDGLEAAYDLRQRDALEPDPELLGAPTLDPSLTQFSRVPITWEEWADAWRPGSDDGEAVPAVPLLPPAPPSTAVQAADAVLIAPPPAAAAWVTTPEQV
jgi:hypothetical protein